MKRQEETQRRLRILFASDHTYLPDRFGGREQSTHELAQLCCRKGHQVAVVAQDHELDHPLRHMVRGVGNRQSSGDGPAAGHLFAYAAFITRRWLWQTPYEIHRTSDVCGLANDLLVQKKFDCAIIQFRQAHRKFHFPPSMAHRYFIYLRDLSGMESLSTDSYPPGVTLLANSGFVSETLGRLCNRHIPVLPPYVERSSYLTKPDGKFVTFINPVSVKGLDLAIEIAAACPEYRFLFVEGWPATKRNKRKLRARVRFLPNIVQHEGVDDMRRIYRQTRLLLVPSQWLEGWGRVVTEAQFSGIPVLASDVGGLPESVGVGGVLMSATAPAKDWAEALRGILNDRSRYRELAAKSALRAEQYWTRAQNSGSTLVEIIRSGLGPSEPANGQVGEIRAH